MGGDPGGRKWLKAKKKEEKKRKKEGKNWTAGEVDSDPKRAERQKKKRKY